MSDFLLVPAKVLTVSVLSSAVFPPSSTVPPSEQVLKEHLLNE